MPQPSDLGLQFCSFMETWNCTNPHKISQNRMGNPVELVDLNGKEWTYSTNANGQTVVNVALNFSVSGNYSATQIEAYKSVIASQFNSTIMAASNGTMLGSITFCNDNKELVQTLNLEDMDKRTAGMTINFNSSVNLLDNKGNPKSLYDVGIDAIHELLHTLRLEHPFELTQTEDTKLLRVGGISYESTSTTDPNIVNNIMNYPMIKIDGKQGSIQNQLTKGQLSLMLKEIDLQQKGYGFVPKYNQNYSQEQYKELYNRYYENYWNNPIGTPVGSK